MSYVLVNLYPAEHIQANNIINVIHVHAGFKIHNTYYTYYTYIFINNCVYIIIMSCILYIILLLLLITCMTINYFIHFN